MEGWTDLGLGDFGLRYEARGGLSSSQRSKTLVLGGSENERYGTLAMGRIFSSSDQRPARLSSCHEPSLSTRRLLSRPPSRRSLSKNVPEPVVVILGPIGGLSHCFSANSRTFHNDVAPGLSEIQSRDGPSGFDAHSFKFRAIEALLRRWS